MQIVKITISVTKHYYTESAEPTDKFELVNDRVWEHVEGCK